MVQSLTERTTEAVAQAALDADHQERNREAWNLPRAAQTVSHWTHRDGLDWHEFRGLHYPNSRRHNFEAIVAYGMYKRSRRARAQPSEGAHLKLGPLSTEPVSLDEWESEGGAST
jgi:hypothetical protein